MRDAELARIINGPRTAELLLTWENGSRLRLHQEVLAIRIVGIGLLAVRPIDGNPLHVRWSRMIWPSLVRSAELVGPEADEVG